MIKPLKIHSAYNPQKEAERFCETIKTNPRIILITEPGESYLAFAFRKKFPGTKIIAVRFTDNYFLESDCLWDAVWRPSNGNLEFFIINNIPDELLPATVFLPWKPAEKVWAESAIGVWKSISAAIKIMQSIILTRSFFGKRWYKNTINNLLFSKKTINWKFENQDSFLVAAGPSLENALDVFKDNPALLEDKFIVAVSSAVQALLARNIKPDLCISTDGGFWAANHLKNIPPDISVAFPCEANIPLKILKQNNCLFLNYDSGLELFLLEKFKISYKKAKRNGTVAGTASDFLLDYTKGNIYIAGLDLKGSKGFSHIQPYEGQKTHEAGFNKLKPAANFVALANFDCRSLETYAKWFSQIPQERAKRLFRIEGNSRKIENIRTVSANDFILNYKNSKNKNEISFDEQLSKSQKKEIIRTFYQTIREEINSGLFFDNLKSDLCNAKENKKTIQKELCELISFDSYIQFIKELFADPKNNKSESPECKMQSNKLKEELSDFIDKQIKRLEI